MKNMTQFDGLGENIGTKEGAINEGAEQQQWMQGAHMHAGVK